MSENVISKADEIMLRMGFPRDLSTPCVKALRESVCQRVSEQGMTDWHISWSDPQTPLEERARAMLEWEWCQERGHYCETEVLDCYPINRRFSTKTMRWSYEFRPDRIMPWLRDQFRRWAMNWRIWRDRYVLRLRNPYSTNGR